MLDVFVRNNLTNATFSSVRTSLPKARKCVQAQPVARRVATPARMSVTDTLATLPTLPLAEGMSVTFPAYLAVFLGTLIPCAFLVILYIQAESRKAGEKIGRGEE